MERVGPASAVRCLGRRAPRTERRAPRMGEGAAAWRRRAPALGGTWWAGHRASAVGPWRASREGQPVPARVREAASASVLFLGRAPVRKVRRLPAARLRGLPGRRAGQSSSGPERGALPGQRRGRRLSMRAKLERPRVRWRALRPRVERRHPRERWGERHQPSLATLLHPRARWQGQRRGLRPWWVAAPEELHRPGAEEACFLHLPGEARASVPPPHWDSSPGAGRTCWLQWQWRQPSRRVARAYSRQRRGRPVQVAKRA